MKVFRKSGPRGFTLVEVVIAIGVVALLLTSFIAVFGPARNQIQNVIAREEADRLLQTLEAELRTLRPNEVGNYATSFDKATDWITNSHGPGGAIFLYTYRADPAQPRPGDGSLSPVPETETIAGVESITVPAVRRRSDTLFEEDVPAVQGRIYYVRLTQMVLNNGRLEPGQPGQITNPQGGGGASTLAAVALRADFFILPTKDLGYVQSFDPSSFTKPVFSRNLAVRR